MRVYQTQPYKVQGSRPGFGFLIEVYQISFYKDIVRCKGYFNYLDLGEFMKFCDKHCIAVNTFQDGTECSFDLECKRTEWEACVIQLPIGKANVPLNPPRSQSDIEIKDGDIAIVPIDPPENYHYKIHRLGSNGNHPLDEDFSEEFEKEQKDKKPEKPEYDQLHDFFFPHQKKKDSFGVKCECGVDAIGGGRHADYCPKYIGG